MFLSTSVAMQQEVKIEKGIQNILVQKISNLVETGEDNISYKKTIEKLNKMQLEKVGTDRSREKPINIIQKNIETISRTIDELKKYENIQYEIELEKNILQENIEKSNTQNNLLKDIKILIEQNNLESEKIKIKEKILEENNSKINEIKNKIEEIDNMYLEARKAKNNSNKIYPKNKTNKKLNISFILLILINILWTIFIPNIIKNKLILYSFTVTIPIYLVFYIWKRKSLIKKIRIIEEDEKRRLEKIKSEKTNLENEQKIYENNSKQIIHEINNKKLENNVNNSFEENKLIKKYEQSIEKDEINSLLGVENINEKIIVQENKINSLKMEMNKLELKKDNIEPELEKLSSLEEELFSLKEQYNNLQKTNDSIELVKKLLSKAYEKMKNNVSPIFTKKLSNNISAITKGKYTNLYFNDEQGLIVEIDNGDYISAEKLSVGTIDQLYLSLRLAMLDEITKEKVPIILDEAFAYYDNKRLKNILQYLITEFPDRQVIIFSCTNREKEILESLNISFNNVIL